MKLTRSTTLLTSAVAAQLLLLTAPVAATPVPLASGAVTTATATDTSSRTATYGATAFDATNDQRVKHDRRVLGHHDCLHKYAVRQARKMAERERIWHQDLQRILADCHMSWVGENVASGYPSGRAVVNDGWMDSPDHRENILARKFRRVEVAARKGDDGRWYAAQVFGKRA